MKETKGEHPSTYVIEDRSNKEDQIRLQIQDHLTTSAMGGVLPEQPDPSKFQRVLDVGCGTGGWLIETAKQYPPIDMLIGVDISAKMVEYARAQAAAAQVSDRVQFQVMDALRLLEFPSAFFDLVNQRFGQSYLRIWDWGYLLQEYQRVTRPGGVVRITEGEWLVESTSPALTHLFDLLLQAFHQAGHSFTQASNGVTCELASLLDRYGFRHVQTRTTSQTYRVGTTEWQAFVEDVRLIFRLLVPFLRKWTQIPDDYEAIYQQALVQMNRPGFVARGTLVTVWGHLR